MAFIWRKSYAVNRTWLAAPKSLYERMKHWAGNNASCWYSFKKMAEMLGIPGPSGERLVKREERELEGYGLIRHTRRGKRLSNRYEFVYHPIFDTATVGGDGTSTSHHLSSDERLSQPKSAPANSTGDGTAVTLVMGHPCPPNHKENQKEESEKNT